MNKYQKVVVTDLMGIPFLILKIETAITITIPSLKYQVIVETVY